MNHIGLFGYIGDGASIKNFNLNNLIIESSSTTSSVTDTVGLVVGYMNGTSSTSIKIEGIGVKDSTIKGGRKATSKFSIIGGGSDVSMAALDGGYNISGDTGVMYSDEMWDNLTTTNSNTLYPWTSNFSIKSNYYMNKEAAWVGSNGTSFGIFKMATYTVNKVGFGSTNIRSTSPLKYMNYFSYDISGATINTTDKNYDSPAIPADTFTAAYGSSYYHAVTLGDTADQYAKKFIDSSGNQIQDVYYQVSFVNSIKHTNFIAGNDYENSNTATAYANSIMFDITSSNGGEINFISCIGLDGNPDTERHIGIWKLNTSDTTDTSFGTFYKDTPNVFDFTVSGGTSSQDVLNTPGYDSVHGDRICGFSFKLPQGRYLIGSSKSQLYFNYISVSGTNGNTGETTSGIPVDFITAITQHVWETTYTFSGVAFTITENTDESFKIKFVRNQYDDPNSHVNVTGTFNNAAVTIYVSTISSDLYTISNDST